MNITAKDLEPIFEETKEVYTLEAFKNAIHIGTKAIIAKGECAQKIQTLFRKVDITSKLGTGGIIAGIFIWPLLFVGIGEKVVLSKYKKYSFLVINDDEKNEEYIWILHKDYVNKINEMKKK